MARTELHAKGFYPLSPNAIPAAVDHRFAQVACSPDQEKKWPVGPRQGQVLRRCVVETVYGPVEVADLFFADGTTTRMVPFGAFSFVD